MKTYPNLIVKTTTEKGRGLFAKVAIPKDTTLGEYTGRLLPDMGESSLAAFLGYTTMCILSDEVVIDPEDKQYGTVLCMGNSSCDPNSEMQTVGDFNIPHLVTIKDIAKGEEITYKYGLDVPPTAFFRKKWKCLCGTAKCVGDQLAWCEEGPAAWRKYEKEILASAVYIVEFLLERGPRNELQQRLWNMLKKDDKAWLPAALRAKVQAKK